MLMLFILSPRCTAALPIQKNFASLNYEPDETEVWRHHEAKRHYKDGAR